MKKSLLISIIGLSLLTLWMTSLPMAYGQQLKAECLNTDDAIKILIPKEGRNYESFTVKITNQTAHVTHIDYKFEWVGPAPVDTQVGLLSGGPYPELLVGESKIFELPTISVGPNAKPGVYKIKITWIELGGTYDEFEAYIILAYSDVTEMKITILPKHALITPDWRLMWRIEFHTEHLWNDVHFFFSYPYHDPPKLALRYSFGPSYGELSPWAGPFFGWEKKITPNVTVNEVTASKISFKAKLLGPYERLGKCTKYVFDVGSEYNSHEYLGLTCKISYTLTEDDKPVDLGTVITENEVTTQIGAYAGYDPINPPQNAIDENFSTITVVSEDLNWILLDFGIDCNINHITMVSENSPDYSNPGCIEVWVGSTDDGVTFDQLLSVASFPPANMGSIVRSRLEPPVRKRYFKLFILDRWISEDTKSGPINASFAELQLQYPDDWVPVGPQVFAGFDLFARLGQISNVIASIMNVSNITDNYLVNITEEKDWITEYHLPPGAIWENLTAFRFSIEPDEIVDFTMTVVPETQPQETDTITISVRSEVFEILRSDSVIVTMSTPVGGIVTPVNKLALLAPWIILAALIAITAVSVAVYLRRR